MCERLALKESIQLLYEQITGQRAHSGEAALREASEACRSVMDALDRARNTISTLLRFVGQEDALDALAESCEQLAEVMFEQGYLLGYERYMPVSDGDRPHLMVIAGPDYGNAPDGLVRKHKAVAQCMSALFEIDPQAPELFTLSTIASSLEQQIQQFYSKDMDSGMSRQTDCHGEHG